MEKNYQQCLEMILHHEGGYVKITQKIQAATNLGVTKRVYEEWVGRTVTLDQWNDYKFLMLHPSTRRTTGIV